MYICVSIGVSIYIYTTCTHIAIIIYLAENEHQPWGYLRGTKAEAALTDSPFPRAAA